MAVLEFTYRPGTFRAVEYDGTNVAEVTALVGDGVVTEQSDGLLRIRVADGETITARAGWWVSVRDGGVFVSSPAARDQAWVPA